MKKFHLFLLLCLIFLQNCASTPFRGIQNGDLVFVTAGKENLSGAIGRVTQNSAQFSYDHVGILSKENGEFFVYHAAPNGGSQKQELQKFLDDAKKQNAEIAVYRLKPEFQNSIPDAISEAKKNLGKPYNFTYILDENAYYCSDFVERAFRKDHIFTLEPMTFKNPKTGKTDDFWVEFYKKQNLEVPEGKPGCNPNGLAKSEKITFLKFIR